MTSEPDSKPGRRPPTIELTATEVEKPAAPHDSPRDTGTGKPADQPAAADPPKSFTGNAASRVKSHAVSGLIGAAAAAAIIAGLWIKGVIPSREAAAPSSPAPSAAATKTAKTDDIPAQADKIEPAIGAQRPEPALGDRLTATQAQTQSLADSLAALSRQVDAAKGASQTAQSGNIDDLANRIAALEGKIKTLSADVTQPSGADDKAARLTIAAEALRAAVERGVPYAAELTAVHSLGVDQSVTAPLEPYAASGIPSATALAHELAALTPALDRTVATPSGDTTFLERIEASAQKLVRITPVEAPAGNDPPAVIARIDSDAARGDIAAALDDIAALPDSAKPLAADWAKTARARNAAISASRQIAADALAVLSKPAAQ